ncbi:hypothetical protein Tco_0778088 [Tanacetum coccineum]
MKMIARKRKRPQPDVNSDDEHRKHLKIVTFEGTIDSEIMERKSFISKLDKVSSPEGDYLVVYRVNGNFKAFNYLMECSESTLEGIEFILWGDLKIMMKSSIEVTDQEFKDGTVIHMLVERKYPLSKELLQRMLDFRLEVEVESTAALDLIRVLNSPCFMVKSWLVQDQTVLGKDYSNLLIADSLLKTIWFINAPCYGNEALASPKANGVCCDAEEMRCKFKIESENSEYTISIHSQCFSIVNLYLYKLAITLSRLQRSVQFRTYSSTTTHYDISLSKYDSFIFDHSNDPFPPVDRSDFYHEEFAGELAHIIFPPE